MPGPWGPEKNANDLHPHTPVNEHGNQRLGGLGRCFSFSQKVMFRFQPLVFEGVVYVHKIDFQTYKQSIMNHLAGDKVLVGSDISIFVITRLFHPLVSGVLDWCLVSPCTYQ